jgi:hypothetical protein
MHPHQRTETFLAAIQPASAGVYVLSRGNLSPGGDGLEGFR